MRRIFAALALGTLIALLPGCSLICDNEEERRISVGTDPELTYTRPGGAAPGTLRLGASLTEFELGRTPFNELFRVIDDGAERDGVVLAVPGDDPSTGERVALYLALPTPLRRGATFAVGGAFAVPLGGEQLPGASPRTLADPDRAEVAFHTGTYHFPPPEYRTTFQASSAEGTVRVADRGGEFVTLELDLSLSDESGRVARLRGRVTAQAERYTPPCN